MCLFFFLLQRFKDELKEKGVMRFTSAPINSGFLSALEAFCLSHVNSERLHCNYFNNWKQSVIFFYNLHLVNGKIVN